MFMGLDNMKMCKECRKKAEITLCKDCYSKLHIKSMWNETASMLEFTGNQHCEIIGMLYELTTKINNLELQLNLAKRLKV